VYIVRRTKNVGKLDARKRAMQAAVGLWRNRRDIGDSITDVGKLDCEIRLLLDLLDEAFDKKSWHGPNLRGSIRGVTAAQAAWRPAPGRHNIWELTLHAAYWKYVVRRRITGEKRGSFVLEGSNFFERPVEQTEAAWKHDVGILVAEHQALRRAVAQLSPGSREAGSTWRSTLHLIRGAAAHDLYHAGQIRLLRRLEAQPT
jgi:DinB superfamily